MVWEKFEEYLQEVLALPTAVFEGPSFGYSEAAASSCFDIVSTSTCLVKPTSAITILVFRDRLVFGDHPVCFWTSVVHDLFKKPVGDHYK
jgi:hypothetical protein